MWTCSCYNAGIEQADFQRILTEPLYFKLTPHFFLLPGPGYGLGLTLNIEEYEYSKSTDDGIGIKVSEINVTSAGT